MKTNSISLILICQIRIMTNFGILTNDNFDKIPNDMGNFFHSHSESRPFWPSDRGVVIEVEKWTKWRRTLYYFQF